MNSDTRMDDPFPSKQGSSYTTFHKSQESTHESLKQSQSHPTKNSIKDDGLVKAEPTHPITNPPYVFSSLYRNQSDVTSKGGLVNPFSKHSRPGSSKNKSSKQQDNRGSNDLGLLD